MAISKLHTESAYLKTKKQAACYLNVSDASIERLIRRADRPLRYVKIGGLVRFRPEDLVAYIEEHVNG
ncbi:MAG: helix-turn-helix domain-containing protein [Bryobacteraceae bacterium]